MTPTRVIRRPFQTFPNSRCERGAWSMSWPRCVNPLPRTSGFASEQRSRARSDFDRLIKPGDALLVFAIELPDDIGNVPTDLAIPALPLALIDSFAGRNGL